MKKHILALAGSAILSSACTSPIPNAQTDIQHTAAIPAKWMMQPSQTAAANHTEWWRGFGSEELNQLIAQGLAANQNLAAAGLTWKKARLAAQNTAISQTPTASGSLVANASHNFDSGINSTHFSTGLNISYQLDLWQKLAAQSQADIWSANASAEDLLAAKLSLEGSIANAYFALLYANDQLALNAQQLAYQQKTYQITQSKYQAGSASRLDLTNAKQTLTALQTTRNTLESNAKQAQNTLTVLLGQPPAAYLSKTSLKNLKLPAISTGVPADVLAQRPDLRAAQYRLQADLGTTAAAERSFYPDINLTAGLSTGGSILANILQNPVGTAAAGISLPFLQYREKSLALKTSQTQYQADLASFRQTLYNAFKDVENAIASLKEAEDNAAVLAQELKDADTVVNLTQIQYNAGAASLQILLDAQERRRSIQSSLLDNRYQRAARRVTLYLALGGGTNSASLANTLLTPP